VTDTAVGTVSMAGGLLKGRTGANAGAMRKITAHSNNTSTTVGMGFVNALGVGDTFIRLPWSRAVPVVSLTTNFVEANAIEATNTGSDLRVVNVKIDELNDQAWVDVILGMAFYNPQAAAA